MSDKQKTFNKAVDALMEQGCKSRNKDGFVLIDSDGNRCAAGWLLTKTQCEQLEKQLADRDYENLFEIPSIVSLLEERGHDVELADDLRYVHDVEHPRGWARHFRDVADNHDLEYPASITLNQRSAAAAQS